jgi:hypothetical protein
VLSKILKTWKMRARDKALDKYRIGQAQNLFRRNITYSTWSTWQYHMDDKVKHQNLLSSAVMHRKVVIQSKFLRAWIEFTFKRSEHFKRYEKARLYWEAKARVLCLQTWRYLVHKYARRRNILYRAIQFMRNQVCKLVQHMPWTLL